MERSCTIVLSAVEDDRGPQRDVQSLPHRDHFDVLRISLVVGSNRPAGRRRSAAFNGLFGVIVMVLGTSGVSSLGGEG
jgi:hypothetical protein